MKITGLDEERHGRRWNGQRALVTGAGQGIGQAVAVFRQINLRVVTS